MSDLALASELYAFNLGMWMDVSLNALAVFEYATTFDQEVSAVWKRRRSGVAFLLFTVRYTMLIRAILSIVAPGSGDPKECAGLQVTADILIVFSFVPTAVFSALRVYALLGGSVRVSAVVFLLQLLPVVINVYGHIRAITFVDPMFGCVESAKFGLKTQYIMIYTSRTPLIIGDALVIIATWTKSFQQLRIQHSLGAPCSLSTLMFRDGTVYFLLLLIFNVLEMSPLTATDGGFVVGNLNGSLPLILVNRFMLNLRQLSDSEARSTGHIGTVSMPMFRAGIDIVGNMGESLEHGWEARDGEELEVEEFPHDADDIGPSEHQSA